MKIHELYKFLSEKMPASLSCEWDNDGLMCCGDPNREVARVLVALDITAAVVEEAIEGGYDVILSHHPLIFRPLRALEPSDPVAKKVIRLLGAGVTAMSFHTRLDAVAGGVNDTLAAALGLEDVVPFGDGGEAIGRIGNLPKPVPAEDFAQTVKRVTEAPAIQLSDAGVPAYRVALLGGGGSGDVDAARAAGADTYLTGELKHNQLTDAPEWGINLIAAGHFYTENLVCSRLCEMVLQADPSVCVRVVNSNAVRTV